MSETKQVTGICTAVTERNGWTEFEIDHGGQYTTKLSTKLQPLIELGRAAGSELAVWTYKQSDGNPNVHKPGTFHQNRYLEKVEVGGTAEQPAANASPTTAHKPLIAGDKDRAITRMAVLRTTAGLYQGSLGDNDVDNDVIVLKIMETARRFEVWVYRDIDEPPLD